MLENDIIEVSESPYNSPLWVVPKRPDAQGRKQWNLVIDYRALNEKTVANSYPMKNITEILEQLGNYKYFSTLDLKSGFTQIAKDPLNSDKTPFSTPFNHYTFKRMSFGIKNAPSTFKAFIWTEL